MNYLRLSFLVFVLAPALPGCITTHIASGEKQILETAEIMEFLMDPIYEDLKDWVESPPEKRADWRGLYVSAYTLAEINNLLYSRTGHAYMLDRDWRDLVSESRAVAAKLADSVRSREDYEAIKFNYLAVVESCNACHARYGLSEDDAPRIDPPRTWMPDAEPDPGAGTISFQ